jgi:hypothetical protein
VLTRPQRADLVADLGEEHAGHRHADALPKSVHLDVDGEGRKVLLHHGCCATSASATRLGRTPDMYDQGPAPSHRPSSRRYKSGAATAIRVPRQGEGRLLAHYRRGLKESAWITIIIVSTRARLFHEDVWTLPVRPSPLRKRFRVDPRCLAEPARAWRRRGRLLFSAKPRQFDEAPHEVLFQAGRQMLATEPPSTGRLVPVMNDAASEAR